VPPAEQDLSESIDQTAGRSPGNTIAPCAGEPSPRRTQPIRQRRRTDIRKLHLLSGTTTRLRGESKRVVEAGAANNAFA
jgi:hypothetical protein